MLGEAFYWLLNMSIFSAFVGIIVLIIGSFKKLPRRFARALWVLPFLRMSVPIALSSKYSLMSLIDHITVVRVSSDAFGDIFGSANFIMAAEYYYPFTYKSGALGKLFGVASIVWLIVAAALLLTFFVLYFRETSELRGAVCFKDNIYISDNASSPAVYGVFHPKMVLPSGWENRDLKYILAHENAHIKGFDNLWRVLAFVIAAIHWFNPFSWLFLKRFLHETELACDERVLARLVESEKKDYASALIDCAEAKSAFSSAFGGARIKARIENILSYERLSVLVGSLRTFAYFVFKLIARTVKAHDNIFHHNPSPEALFAALLLIFHIVFDNFHFSRRPVVKQIYKSVSSVILRQGVKFSAVRVID